MPLLDVFFGQEKLVPRTNNPMISLRAKKSILEAATFAQVGYIVACLHKDVPIPRPLLPVYGACVAATMFYSTFSSSK